MATTLNSLYWDAVAGDRSYDALDRAHQFAAVASDGYVPGRGDECKVTPTTVESMAVRLMTGRLWIQGRLVLNDSSPVLETVDAADSTNKRIDTFVVRLDPSGRVAEADIVKGTAAVVPAAPTLTQTTDGEWEHPLADLHIPPGATQIYASQGQAPSGQGWIVDRRVQAYSALPGPFPLFKGPVAPTSNEDLSSSTYTLWPSVASMAVAFPDWATKAHIRVSVHDFSIVTATANHALRLQVGSAVAGPWRVRGAVQDDRTLNLEAVVGLPSPPGTLTCQLQGQRVSGTGALRANTETFVTMQVEPRR